MWKETLESAEKELLETLLVGILEKMNKFENDFWNGLAELGSTIHHDQLLEWLAKLFIHLETEEKKIIK